MIQATRKQRQALKRENEKQPVVLQLVPREKWAPGPPDCLEVWRSRYFLVQIFENQPLPALCRLSVCRTTLRADGRWDDGISWDELQRIKSECGFGGLCAVEIYPPNADIVNVANHRHLWVLAEAPSFVWRRP